MAPLHSVQQVPLNQLQQLQLHQQQQQLQSQPPQQPLPAEQTVLQQQTVQLNRLPQTFQNFNENYNKNFVSVMNSGDNTLTTSSLNNFSRQDILRSGESAESSCSSLSSTSDQIEPSNVNVPNNRTLIVNFSGSSVSSSPNIDVSSDSPVFNSESVVNVSEPISVGSVVNQNNYNIVTINGVPTISVPHGWKRLNANGTIIYVSPSNTALSTLDQVKAYLQTQGTCKCGLECPLKCDLVFNFDSKISSRPASYNVAPNNPSELANLCNHKRKLMSSLQTHPLSLPLLSKIYPSQVDVAGLRRKKRRVVIGQFPSGNQSISQPIERDRLTKDGSSSHVMQDWNENISQQISTPTQMNPGITPGTQISRVPMNFQQNTSVMNPTQQYFRFNSPCHPEVRSVGPQSDRTIVASGENSAHATFQNSVYQSYSDTNSDVSSLNDSLQSSTSQRIPNGFPNQVTINQFNSLHHSQPSSIENKPTFTPQQLQLLHQQQLQQQQLQQQQLQEQQLQQQLQLNSSFQLQSSLPQRQVEGFSQKNFVSPALESCSNSQPILAQQNQFSVDSDSNSKQTVISGNELKGLKPCVKNFSFSRDALMCQNQLGSNSATLISNQLNPSLSAENSSYPANQLNLAQNCPLPQNHDSNIQSQNVMLQNQQLMNSMLQSNQQVNQQNLLMTNQAHSVNPHNLMTHNQNQHSLVVSSQNQQINQHNLNIPDQAHSVNQPNLTLSGQNQTLTQHNLVTPNQNQTVNQPSLVSSQNQSVNQPNLINSQNQSPNQHNLISSNQAPAENQHNIIPANQNQQINQHNIISSNQNQQINKHNILPQNPSIINNISNMLSQNQSATSQSNSSSFVVQNRNQFEVIASDNFRSQNPNISGLNQENSSILRSHQVLASNLVQQSLNQGQVLNQQNFNVHSLPNQSNINQQLSIRSSTPQSISIHSGLNQIPSINMSQQNTVMNSIPQDNACSSGSVSSVNPPVIINEQLSQNTQQNINMFSNQTQFQNSQLVVQNSTAVNSSGLSVHSSNNRQVTSNLNIMNQQQSTSNPNLLISNNLESNVMSNNSCSNNLNNVPPSNNIVVQNQLISSQNQPIMDSSVVAPQSNSMVPLIKNTNYSPNNIQIHSSSPVVEQNILVTPTNSGIRQRSIPPWQQNRINAVNQQLQLQSTTLEQAQQNVVNQGQWNEENSCYKKITIVKQPAKSPPNIQQLKKPKQILDNRESSPVVEVRSSIAESSDNFLPSTSSAPSFMDDPSGYLAQQTALLNSTISRQTGINSFNCDNPIIHVNNKTSPKNTGSIQGVDSTSVSYPDSSGNSSGRKSNESQNDSPPCDRRFKSSDGVNQQPVTSSTFAMSISQASLQNSSEPCSPVQGGTVSTSIQSPLQLERNLTDGNPNTSVFTFKNQTVESNTDSENESRRQGGLKMPAIVTTMASGHTVSCNTITSVLAGRTNTATVSINTPVSNSSPVVPSIVTTNVTTTMTVTSNSPATSVTKSPLEMVQSVVSSIQIPNSASHPALNNENKIQGQSTGHILVSSNGQFIVASSNNQNFSKINPSNQIPSIVTQANNNSITQVLPTLNVGSQQVLGQPTVLVNNFSTPLVFQQGLINVDGTMNTVQIPQLTVATNNVLQANQIIDDSRSNNGRFSPRQHNLLSPDSLNNKRKNLNKKRKVSTPTVASMLQIASQQNSASNQVNNLPAGMVTVQQAQPQANFSAQQSTPMLQTLILPNKNNNFNNGQPVIATANVLQPLNLVHNFPTIQQFIVPTALGGMVMTAGDGTATLLQDALQLNVLTPVQNHSGAVFNANGQNILTSPAGMVIRAPTVQTSMGKIQIQTAPNGQLIATNSPNQFIVGGSPSSTFTSQLSPIVASVSPNHSFTSPNPNNCNQPQEFIQCITSGQRTPTLMVPCSITPQQCSPQNTTVVQRNTTIVQQQMTMVSNNNQQNMLESQQNQSSNLNQHNLQIIHNDQGKSNQANSVIITTDKNNQQNFLLSPKTNCDKSTHFIIHQSNLNDKTSASQSQPSFIISNASPESDKSICGNFLLSTAHNQHEKLLQQGKIIINTSNAPNNVLIDTSRSQQSNFLKQSVSTQTASTNTVNQQNSLSNLSTNLVVATNSTLSQTSNAPFYSVSPPDTTTHSPIDTANSPGLNPNKPETPSSSVNVGSTDDSSPSPSSTTIPMSSSDTNKYQTQPMVHYVSSSNEQDMPADWSDNSGSCNEKSPVNSSSRVESSCSTSPLQNYDEISIRHLSKSHSNSYNCSPKTTSHQRHHSSMDHRVTTLSTDDCDDNSDADTNSESEIEGETRLLGLSEGDLVWGAARGFPSWPGKLVGPAPTQGRVWVRWFGGPNSAQLSEVDPKVLKTLSEGLEAHHRACKKFRKSRKLNSQLEKAIQEAMAELDRMSETPEQGAPVPPVNAVVNRRIR